MFHNLFKSVALFVGLSISLGILVIGIISLRSYFTRASSTSADPKNVRATNITDTGSAIVWETEIDTQGLVRYATDPSSFKLGNSSGLLFSAENSTGKTHEVKLSLLKPNTTYYYEISIGSDIYSQGGLVKNDNHLPYSFTTTQQTADTKKEESVLPSLNAETFKTKFGTKDALYDLNKDGTVNSTDYLIFLSKSATPTP